MSSSDDSITKVESIVLLVISLGMVLWYAIPQAFFAPYPLYEFTRLIWPDLLNVLSIGG